VKRTFHLDAAVQEVGRLGVRAEPLFVDAFRIGMETAGTVYTTSPAVLCDQEQALEWACIVASLELGVLA
jgi:hypothetical protein